MHIGRRNQLLVLLTIRCEGYTTVEEYLDIRPHLFQMRLTRYFHHAVQHREHPGRHATDIGDVLRHGFTGYTLAFHLKVAE